ncbi:isochorismatase family protein [Oxyplasma meridianum]|uniref:Isochorismatase family protein n=1 Tax=Oxyplasma meridianum TaxID=3073602 RepID=A0AAX4NG99_9ARCH
MNQEGHVDISHILNPDTCLLIQLNFHEDLFRNSFSKMEFIMAMDYLTPKVSELNMRTINVDTTHAILPSRSGNIKRENYDSLKRSRKERLIPMTSQMDMQFIDRFSMELSHEGKEIQSSSEDIMLDSNIVNKIELFSPSTLIFTGFKTDYEVMASAITASMRGYYSVVVSDATSTYSERFFFSSLELMSQILEVIDTRDLMRVWGYDQ